jgi:succinoglycan biosynthesis protein ExoM
MTGKHHITVCICTYKRPEYLKRLLEELEKQETDNLFHYSIIIVDNDNYQAAERTVLSYSQGSKMNIKYFIEPEQNIALARNKAVEMATGDYLSFIDDDEFPGERWLLELYKAMLFYQADGVLGPVLPLYEREPPKWVLKGHFFERPNHETGEILPWKNTRTGNVLFRKDLFEKEGPWFNPNHGSGGEDRDFFRKKINENRVFLWCNEAPVYEAVPPVRWERSFMIKRAFLRGKVAFENSSNRHLNMVKSLFASILYTVGLPVFFIFGQHIFMKYLIRNCHHIGSVLTGLKLNIVKEKYVTG